MHQERSAKDRWDPLSHWLFWDKGYKLEEKGEKTFTIHRQYRAYEGKLRGMDHYLRFRDETDREYKCFIEVKNWKHYKNGISEDMFKKRILRRFTLYDIFRRRCWILAINYRNIPYIEKNCKKHNIHIIPIQDHITKQYISPFVFKPILEQFIDDFSDFIDKMTAGNIRWGIREYIKARWGK